MRPTRDISAVGFRISSNMDCVVPNDISVQLVHEITKGFSKKLIIGGGSTATVYMGEHKDGTKIAVKVLDGKPEVNDEQFQNEFDCLKRLDHQNIVRLVGCCYEAEKEHFNEMGKLKRYPALCLEYMNNGSLDKYISDENSGHSWSTSYKIIKGMCEGLKYLHEELKPSIYHLDLKPANVLLDENMLPKISDFGLSKLFGEERTQILRNDRGTDAYSPPEYKKSGIVSRKFDIFSLGVVIMKMMAGRRGYLKRPDMSSKQFNNLVQGNWKKRIQEGSKCCVDIEIAQVKTCLEIAISCVECDPNKRPNIGDIVNKLNQMEPNVLLEKNFALSVKKLNETETNNPEKNCIMSILSSIIDSSKYIDSNFKQIKELARRMEDLSRQIKDSGFADMSFQQSQHVHRNERNRRTSTEDRRRSSGKTRHIRSSSASKYTLMRNWKY